jgi:hypothetical protein
MVLNGEDLKICSENLADMAPALRDHISTILTAPNLSEMAQEIQLSAELADQMLNGLDRNEDGKIEPDAEECGVLVAYEATYHMADMPLLPLSVNVLGTLTAMSETIVPSQAATPSSPFNTTPTKRPDQNAAPATAAPTSQSQPQPQPTSPSNNNNNQPKPTKKPKPTEKPNSPADPNPNPRPTKKKP